MHDKTFYEAWGWLIFVRIGACFVSSIFAIPVWFQYKKRKCELGVPEDYTFKDHIKWLFEGVLGDIWGIFRVILKIVAVIAGAAIVLLLLYLIQS